MSPHLLRRFYIYSAILVSLVAVLAGAMLLLRAHLPGVDPQAGWPAQIALPLLLAGLTVLLVHAGWAQVLAARDPEERASLARGLSLYGIQFAAAMVALWQGLALIDRGLLRIFSLPAGDTDWLGELATILIAAALAGLATRILARDWRTIPAREDFTAARRLSRYAWVLAGLVLTLLGAQQLMLALFLALESQGRPAALHLVTGLASLLPGLPLLVFADRQVRRSLVKPEERQSLLRLAALHMAVLAGIAGLLVSAVWILRGIALIAGGEAFISQGPLAHLATPLSLLVPSLYLLRRYGRTLQLEMRAPPTLPGSPPPATGAPLAASRLSPLTVKRATQPQRQGLRRGYFYLVALLGLGATGYGLWSLLHAVVALFDKTLPLSELRAGLAGALAGLLPGLPLWWRSWFLMQREAAAETELGEKNRRSYARRIYLLIVLVAGAAGLAWSAARILDGLLAEPAALQPVLLREGPTLLLAVVLLISHGLVHWHDQRRMARARARRHAQYPVLVLAPDEPLPGEAGAPKQMDAARQGGALFGSFAGALVTALQRNIPALPVAVHYYSQGAPNETLSAARAVILPAELLARPPEALRLWLQAFNGRRLVVPTPTRGWHWVNTDNQRISHLARQAARLIRKFAEEP